MFMVSCIAVYDKCPSKGKRTAVCINYNLAKLIVLCVLFNVLTYSL